MTKQPLDEFDPQKMSDERLRQFLWKIFETPDVFDDETDPEEIQKRQLRVEAKRTIANHRRDIRLSVTAPLTTDRNKNPLYHCAVLGETKEVSLLLPTKDFESRVLKGTIRLKSEKSVKANQQPIVELPKKEPKETDSLISLPADGLPRREERPDTSELADFWFEVQMKLAEGFSIVGATLFENTNALSIDQFKSDSPIPKSTAKAVAHFDCESDPSNPDLFELYCYSSLDRLRGLSSVLVFQVKETAK
jgi:hypothetical protein